MNVDDVVAEKIAAARARAEAAKRRRAAFKAARQRGLAARHAQKLRNLNRGDTPTTDDLRGAEDHEGADDDVVIEVTEAEFHAAVRTSLARLGLTYAELEDQARRRDFTSAQAHSLWTSVGGAVNPDLLEEQ
ncbi:hypothetical protein [Streptomyces sp. NPDC058252]|uniref:hypothetical protein n=1 Tax=Streptomyces sp. NPDC058252 TaxID=3346405 RepID=UPI0036E5C6F9